MKTLIALKVTGFVFVFFVIQSVQAQSPCPPTMTMKIDSTDLTTGGEKIVLEGTAETFQAKSFSQAQKQTVLNESNDGSAMAYVLPPPPDPCDPGGGGGGGGGGCTSPVAYNVSGGGSVCSPGDDLIPLLEVRLSGSQVGVTYRLYRDGSLVSSSKSGTGGGLSWNVSASGTYSIRGTNACGTTTMSGTASVRYVTAPIAYTVSGGGVICTGAPTFSVTLSDSEVGVNYQLRLEGLIAQATVAGTGNSITWSNLTTPGTYTVTAGRLTCKNIPMNGSASISVGQVPMVFDVTHGRETCDGPFISLSGSQSGVTYRLKKDDVFYGNPLMGTGSGLTWTANITAGTYSVEAVSHTGCSQLMSGSTVVPAPPIPAMFNIHAGASFCAGSESTLSLTGSEINVSYDLKLNGISTGSIQQGTGAALIWAPIVVQTGTYSITATNTIGCTQEMSGALEIVAAVIAGDNSIFGNSAIILQTVTGQGFTYQWKKDGDVLPAENSSSLTVNEPGNYQVTVSYGVCSSTSPLHFVTKRDAYYNGLISSVRWRTDKAHEVTGSDFTGMYIFNYDDNYQFKDAVWAQPDFVLNTFSPAGNVFRVSGLKYDPNGNIQFLKRYNGEGQRMHDFAYDYVPNKNKLQSVSGYVSHYTYNAIGQMTGEDKIGGDDQFVEYDVSGKVVKVFSDAARQLLKVKYIYDDRGFRLAKVNAVKNVTTWYLRDGSGNVISVYEQAGSPAAANTNALVEKEIPLYGSGKLGTLYPQEENSTAYEITDHLGNVRALVREDVNTYTATLEDNGSAEYTNPRVREMSFFQNLFETAANDANMNHTPSDPSVVSDPSKSAYLFWQSGMVGMDAEDKALGPAAALRVNPGDKLALETWVRYKSKNAYSRGFDLMVLSQLFGATFGTTAGFEGMTPTQTASSFNSAFGSANFRNDDGDDERPFAYLNFIVFNDNLQMVDAGWQRVPENIGFATGEEGLPDSHHRVAIPEEIEIEQSGYIYVWLSNESENTEVWFDDLSITHTRGIVTQATDYGVWGDVLREQKSDERKYRYGYQGQFAEKDEETGWNHFELREYDPVIGRWLVPDVYKVHWSPYLSMNNNPVNSVDPDGGCETGNCPPKMGDIKDNTMFDGKDWIPISQEVVVNIPATFYRFKQEMPYTVDLQRHQNYLFNRPRITADVPTLFDKWSDYEGYTAADEFLVDMTYTLADGAYVTAHFFTPWNPDIHLNGRPTEGKDKMTAFANTAASLMPANAAVSRLSIAHFGGIFKGTFLLKPAIKREAMSLVNWAIPRALTISKATATGANSLINDSATPRSNN